MIGSGENAVSPWHVIPEEWKPRLRAYLRAICGEDRDHISAHDFRCDQLVHLTFDDGSFAMYHYAFAVLDESGERCMVFTEHCGYHVFPVGTDGVQFVQAMPPDGSADAKPDASTQV